MIEQFLNVRHSTRNLTDIEFEDKLPTLAQELVRVDYTYNYSDEVLLNDWNKLCNYSSDNQTSSSTVRVGVKLCEHFFPNFFLIESPKGQSFKKLWNPSVLEKVLRWNRKSHSTPYLSELRRGIYFTQGLTKNTMYRPHIAKSIIDKHGVDRVLDPCCGWGGRLLGSVASGKYYIGFEPNIETFKNLNFLVEFLNIENKVTLINDGAENIDNYNFPDVDVVLTSPPYFNLEIYSNSDKQCENMFSTYDEWKTKWLFKIIDIANKHCNGVSCWNVHNIGKMKMIDDIREHLISQGYKLFDVFGSKSSARQFNQTQKSHKKSSDVTNIFKRDSLAPSSNG